MRELWAATTGIPEVCIAILDGAADVCHPCLRAAHLELADPLNRARVQDSFTARHGTAVASLLFGRHDAAVKGVAPGCSGLIIPIYEATYGALHCTQSDLALAIRDAVQRGADVINVSGGELATDGQASRDLADAVKFCVGKGRLLVAASGNDGCAECLHVPGALPSVLAVGAMEPDGTPLPGSNWGKAYQANGLVAPGRNILVAAPGDEYALATGTSLATPLVSGVAALLASLQRRFTGHADMPMIRRILLASATGCQEQPIDECDRLLVGRLNITRALSYFLKL
jgi:cyanobactin maturation PatA/PatG family protease